MDKPIPDRPPSPAPQPPSPYQLHKWIRKVIAIEAENKFEYPCRLVGLAIQGSNESLVVADFQGMQGKVFSMLIPSDYANELKIGKKYTISLSVEAVE